MARISDVAQLAGVSTATVSRVLNGKQVRPELAAAVLRATEELGYSPNRTARSLRRQKSEVIALILADIENPFFTSLARGVEDVAQSAGLSVVLCNSDDDPVKEDRYLDIAWSENMAGVIIAPSGQSPNLTRLVDRGTAVVVVDRPVHEEVDHVLFDNVDLGRRSTNMLLASGYRRIGCITGPSTTVTAEDRATGWELALSDAGIDVPEELLVHVNFRVDGGRRAMRALLSLEDPLDAVLATNNLVGVGALQTIAAHPVGVRSQLGIGIIGDLPFLTCRPERLSLTPLLPREMGGTAAQVLVDRLKDPGAPIRRLIQPTPGVLSGPVFVA